jgi:DTW domain-containing protein YfiP
VETRTRIVIVRHQSERWKPSNSAYFAKLALPSCEMHDYGVPDEPLPELDTDGAWVLYPDGDPPPPGARPSKLIVLDGSWSQARRMRRRITALRGLPFLRLPPPVARPRMRRPLHADGMSTLEAISAAVALLEGADRAAPLERLHDRIATAMINRG